MKWLKLGLTNTNPTVGAVKTNPKKLLEEFHKYDEAKCHIVVAPESCLLGYSPEDLVTFNSVLEQQHYWIDQIRRDLPKNNTYYIFGANVNHNGLAYNVAVVIRNQQIVGIVPKHYLPTYGVFDEGRVFTKAPATLEEFSCKYFASIPFGVCVFDTGAFKFAVDICEDGWVSSNEKIYAGAELIINCSASPYRRNIYETRKRMLATRSADGEVTIAYINQFGGNDALVYDGGGFVYQNGNLIHELPRFEQVSAILDIDLERTNLARRLNTTWRTNREENPSRIPVIQAYSSSAMMVNGKSVCSETAQLEKQQSCHSFSEANSELRSLCQGLHDYYEKSGCFEKYLVALSGGYDSVFATLIVAAMLKLTGQSMDKLVCVSMPSKFNSDKTQNISRELCQALGVRLLERPIEDAVRMFSETIYVSDKEVDGVTHQNLQPRIRSLIMWQLSNQFKGLWVQTGNKTERAAGYFTIGGDSEGSYSITGDLDKTRIIEFLHEFHNFPFGLDGIPEDAITLVIGKMLFGTVPSAELAEGQSDERDLMPFVMQDMMIDLVANKRMNAWEAYHYIAATEYETITNMVAYEPGKLKIWVCDWMRRFIRNIWKWEQLCPSVHVDDSDLDRTRALRLPIVQSLEWTGIDELLENETLTL